MDLETWSELLDKWGPTGGLSSQPSRNMEDLPLLIIHGSEDTSVAPFLGDEVFLGLRRLGKEAEYAKYTGEDHAPPYWQYQNQVDVCKRILRWLSVHLDGGH